jgi:hypothetical protein
VGSTDIRLNRFNDKEQGMADDINATLNAPENALDADEKDMPTT